MSKTEVYYICRAEDPDDCSTVSDKVFARVLALARSVTPQGVPVVHSHSVDSVKVYVEATILYALHVVEGRDLKLCVLYV